MKYCYVSRDRDWYTSARPQETLTLKIKDKQFKLSTSVLESKQRQDEVILPQHSMTKHNMYLLLQPMLGLGLEHKHIVSF